MIKTGETKVLAQTINSEGGELKLLIEGAIRASIRNEGSNAFRLETDGGTIEILPNRQKVIQTHPYYPIVDQWRFLFDQPTVVEIIQTVISREHNG